MEKETISITLNGVVFDDNNKWLEWYNESKMLIKSLGYEPTHVGIASSTLNTGKVMNLKRYEKEIFNSIQSGDKIEYISVYSLPNKYDSASFDYNVFLARDDGYLTLIMNKSDFNNKKEEYLISILKKYIDSTSCEIYEMDRRECSLLYAAKDNPASFFKSINIIKSWNTND